MHITPKAVQLALTKLGIPFQVQFVGSMIDGDKILLISIPHEFYADVTDLCSQSGLKFGTGANQERSQIVICFDKMEVA